AEATLMVSGNRRGDGPLSVRFSAAALAGGRAVADPDGAALMACGVAQDGHAIRIVDPATGEPCADGIVGEIRYAGPSVAGGYW
ncbi:AMP-binding protein, partial [Acinetobacter baumannii]